VYSLLSCLRIYKKRVFWAGIQTKYGIKWDPFLEGGLNSFNRRLRRNFRPRVDPRVSLDKIIIGSKRCEFQSAICGYSCKIELAKDKQTSESK